MLRKSYRLVVLFLIFGSLAFAEDTPQISTLPYQLVGTIIRPEAEKSIATVRTSGGKIADNFRLNSKIKDAAEVVDIKREQLYFRNFKTGKIEYIRTAPYDPKFAPSSKQIDSDGNQKEFQLSRCLVNKVLKDLPEFLNSAAMVPVQDSNGVVQGFKFNWIKEGSLFQELGLKVGDMIQSVNGMNIRSLQDAVQIFEQLRNSSLVKLQITRSGRAIELTYLVREEPGKC